MGTASTPSCCGRRAGAAGTVRPGGRPRNPGTRRERAQRLATHGPAIPHQPRSRNCPVADHLLRPGLAAAADHGVLPTLSAPWRPRFRHRFSRRQPGAYVSLGSAPRSRRRAAADLVATPSAPVRPRRRCGSRRVGSPPAPAGELRLSTRTPTVSTFADSWIEDVEADPRFRRLRWDNVVSAAGDPRRTRGPARRAAVLQDRCGGLRERGAAGLTRPVPALSFEYIPVSLARAVACVERTTALGDYRYRYSRVETHRWAVDTWLDAEAMIEVLRSLPLLDRSGDVYAVRSDQLSSSERGR